MAGKKRTREGGAAIVEIAVLLPLLLAMLVGGIDLARGLYEAIVIDGGAKAGAIWGSQHPSTTTNTAGIAAAVMRDIGDAFDPADVTIVSERYCQCGNSTTTVDCDSAVCLSGSTTPRTYVRVQVTKTFNTIVNYPYVANSIVLTREARQRAR